MEYILANRHIIAVTGAEASSFLQGIVTANVETLELGACTLCAMLNPQGKLAHDFFVFRTEDGFFIDVDASDSVALMKKFKLYKMRTAVVLAEVSEDYSVMQSVEQPAEAVISSKDIRAEALGYRSIVAKSEADDTVAYDAWRHANALPEAARDSTERTFLLDLGYDAMGAVDFEKGCYVGQEVTARMHYKNARRRAPFIVLAEAELSGMGAKIYAGENEVGELRSAHGKRAFAVCRWEEVEKHQGEELTVNGEPVTLEVPSWFEGTYEKIKQAKQEAM